MSQQITTAFVQQYGSNVQHLAQQMASRLRNCVEVETGLRGKAAYFDQIGKKTAQKITSRHGDSPINDTPHARRRVTPVGYEDGDMIDDFDKLQTLIDPSSDYVRSSAAAHGRAIDVEINLAALGTAYTGEDGSTTVALPASQKVAVGTTKFGGAATGLSVAKLIEARHILGYGEGDNYDTGGAKLYIACSQGEISALLTDSKVQSRDYNTVQALVAGEVDQFMGFKFVRVDRNILLKDGSNDYRIPAWEKGGIKLGIWADFVAEVAKRPDKKFNWYYYTKMVIGATRMQEEKVVEIACTPVP